MAENPRRYKRLLQVLNEFQIMPNATFDEWIRAVFDHPLCKPVWYWDDGFDQSWDALDLFDSLTVDYLTRLFLGPDCLKPYSLEQVAQGIWFLIGESSPGQSAYALLKSDVPLERRIGCMEGIANFFRVFVAPAAPAAADEQRDPFHMACYMWWDIFPTYGSPNAGEPNLHSACLKVMAEILALPCELCQLSALHGLNHWHLHHAVQVESIVDAFLLRTSGVAPRMVEYAAIARLGNAL